MWKMIAIAYLTIGLVLALFTSARGVIKRGIAISGIADSGYSEWIVTAFQIAVYSVSVLIWPILFYRLLASTVLTEPTPDHSKKETAMGLFGLFGKKTNDTKVENPENRSIFDEFNSARTQMLGEVFGEEFQATMERISCFSPLDVGDQFPNGYGEFGLTPTNPIPLTYNESDPKYFSLLRTYSGEEVTFDVVDVVDSDVVSPEFRALMPEVNPIQELAISAGGIKVATLYSLPCCTRESKKAPRGFNLISLSAEEDFNRGVEAYIARKHAEAFKWLLKAAEQDHPDAQYFVSSLYREGEIVAQDYEQGIYWCRRSADLNKPQAQFSLGASYEHGRGVDQNDIEAMKWYRRSAENGFAEAQYNLANAYFHGQSVSQDYAQAVNWYRKAAEQGLADAQFNLSICYGNGQGVQQDGAQAEYWLSKSKEER